MNNVNGIHPISASKAVHRIEPISIPHGQMPMEGITDVVEISAAAILAAKVHELPEVRMNLVDRIKGEIAAGTYETPERIDGTVDRLMDELFPGL